MTDNKRASSLPSSASSRKEKQSKCGEKDSHELIKGKLLRKTSSISSPSTPSKKGKKSESCLKDNDHHEFLKAKVLTRRASSLSSSSTPPSKKGKQIMKENHDDNLKGKLARRTNSFSSLPTRRDNHNDNVCHNKEKPLRKASLLSSSSSHSSTKREKSSMSNEKSRKTSSLIKSRIKELGPICKKRKEVLDSIQLDEDIDVYLDKQIEGEGKINSNDCLWLSSGSMSPQEFGLFMSALDPCLDEWVLSFLPRSSRTPNACDDSKAIIPVCEANSSGESSLAHSQSIDSSSSSLALSTCTDSSSFWNMDRTGVWVSLINLSGEESEFISNMDTKLDDLESNFPSPSYEINWDSYSSDVGVSSSAMSTAQESGSQSEWSSDLLSDSLDWELESNDPIFWPFGVDCDWDHKDAFSVSPRKGIYKIKFASKEHSSSSVNNTPDDDSIRFRLGSKNGKRILFMSGLSASKMIEFKKGCRKSVAKGKRFSKIGKRGSRYERRVPPILENDLEGISPKETPPKESSNKGNQHNFSDIDLILSECTDNWGDEMDCDGPLFWPTDQKTDWNLTWDSSFNISPRKGTQSSTNLGSPKNGFAVSSSVRLKFIPKSKALSSNMKSGLSASKSLKFKTTYQKKTNAVTAASKSSVVIAPRKRRCMFKPSHGNKSRKKFLKVGNKSVHELIRLVSFVGMNKMFPGNEVNYSEELPIETLVGLDAFAGHEGFGMQFEDADFSLIASEVE